MQVQSALFFESPEEIFARVFREIKPRTSLPAISVGYFQYANANSFIRLEAGKLEVKIADVLQGAPAPILEALAWILISKLYRKKVPSTYNYRYRIYLNRKDVRRTLELVRQIRGRKFISGPQGRCFHLGEIFDWLNQRFFNGLMAQPLLGWSRKPSRTTLGHYDSSHNAIILSSFLDSPEVPPLVVDYIMFHEMLHLQHPVEHQGARRRIHTREFHEAEKTFPGVETAQSKLKELCAGPKLQSEKKARAAK